MDGVVLLHGIARRAASLAGIERKLAAAGYCTLNLDYPSRRYNLHDIAAGLHPAVSRFQDQVDGRLHFVTHSMGGLVTRCYVTRHRPERLGHVVMLAPPNEGSEIADFLSRNPLYRAFFGPAGHELGTVRSAGLRDLLGPIDFSLGIIAGNRSLYPISSLILPRPNDGRVSVARTRVSGASDHITLPTSHPLIMRHPLAMEQTLHFLRHGRFRR